jgi:hypothetical protein
MQPEVRGDARLRGTTVLTSFPARVRTLVGSSSSIFQLTVTPSATRQPYSPVGHTGPPASDPSEGTHMLRRFRLADHEFTRDGAMLTTYSREREEEAARKAA